MSASGRGASRWWGFECRGLNDSSGDQFDALLCAIQAAWAWTRRDQGFGLLEYVDPLAGWIADPHIRVP